MSRGENRSMKPTMRRTGEESRSLRAQQKKNPPRLQKREREIRRHEPHSYRNGFSGREPFSLGRKTAWGEVTRRRFAVSFFLLLLLLLCFVFLFYFFYFLFFCYSFAVAAAFSSCFFALARVMNGWKECRHTEWTELQTHRLCCVTLSCLYLCLTECERCVCALCHHQNRHHHIFAPCHLYDHFSLNNSFLFFCWLCFSFTDCAQCIHNIPVKHTEPGHIQPRGWSPCCYLYWHCITFNWWPWTARFYDRSSRRHIDLMPPDALVPILIVCSIALSSAHWNAIHPLARCVFH